MRTCHELKCSDMFYSDVDSGIKPFELRKDDRNYKVGDHLWLREIRHVPDHNPMTESLYKLDYSGKSCIREVTYCLRNRDYPAVPEGWVILGLKQVLQ